MEKILEILEKHCQWLAIGLGELFLAWALWAYLLMSPASKTVNGNTYAPGDVDTTIRKSVTEPLEEATKQQGAVEVPPQDDKIGKGPFTEVLNSPPMAVAALSQLAFSSQAADTGLRKDEQKAVTAAQMVTKLPVVPPSDPFDVKAARANVGPAPAAVVPGVNGQPAAPPPAPAAPATPVVGPGGRDISYVRLAWKVPTVEMAAEFKNVNVPQTAQTAIVGVKVIRQEMQPDGNWGPQQDVTPFKNNVAIQPAPSDGAGMGAVNTFRAWSDSADGQTALLRPIFYPVLAGEGPWDPPAEDLLPKYDPVADRIAKAAAAKAAADAKRNAAPRGPSTPSRGGPAGGARRGPPGGGGTGEPSGAAPDPQRPATAGGMLAVQAPPVPQQPGIDGPPTEPQPGQPAPAPGAGQSNAEPLPAPNFQPAITPAITAWAYDENVQEGHTYRYQVLYAIRSPVYESNITNPKQLADTFQLWSQPDDKAWSKEVHVPPTAEFYVNGANWRADHPPTNIKIDVFKWALGKWQTASFTVSPGDEIGQVDKAGVDFRTGVRLVDFCIDARGNMNLGRSYLLLLEPDGRLSEREPTADRNNVRMMQLKMVIQTNSGQAGAPGQPLQPGGPGGPPVPGLPGGPGISPPRD